MVVIRWIVDMLVLVSIVLVLFFSFVSVCWIILCVGLLWWVIMCVWFIKFGKVIGVGKMDWWDNVIILFVVI